MNPNKKPELSLDELDFLNMVLMLGNTASVELGLKRTPSGEKLQNLPRARQLINMLVVLEKKSEGRRTHEEDRVLKNVLRELQDEYVHAAGLDTVRADNSAIRANFAAQAYSRTRKG